MKLYTMSGAAQRLLAVLLVELAFYPSFLKGDIFYHIFAVNDFGYNLALIYFIHVSVTTGALLWVKVRKCKKQLFFPFHLNSRSFLTVLCDYLSCFKVSRGCPSSTPCLQRVTINFFSPISVQLLLSLALSRLDPLSVSTVRELPTPQSPPLLPGKLWLQTVKRGLLIFKKFAEIQIIMHHYLMLIRLQRISSRIFFSSSRSL